MTHAPSGRSDEQDLHRRLSAWDLHHFHKLTSTHDHAKEAVAGGDVSPPAIVSAEMQQAGRGRGGNTWWSAPGNLACTFVVHPNLKLPFGWVPLLAGLAVRRALLRLAPVERVMLKWPNDLIANGKKLAGLLCERLPKADLVGVGINVNAGPREAPTELRDRLTSLRDLTGKAWKLNDILVAVAEELLHVLSTESEEDVRDLMREFESHHALTGHVVTLVDSEVSPECIGRCEGVDSEGRLLLRTSEGLRACLTGTLASIGPRIAAKP